MRFTVPVSTLYTLVELRGTQAGEERVWKAVLPASFDEFTFRSLPPEVSQVLASGMTWTLEVTAARGSTCGRRSHGRSSSTTCSTDLSA